MRSIQRLLGHGSIKTTSRYAHITENLARMPLKALEFMRRFLQHVRPKGVHKVRYYGFLSPTNRDWLKRIQTLLLLKRKVEVQEQEKERNQPESSDNSGNSTNKDKYKICPVCMRGFMVELMRRPSVAEKY